MRKIIVLLLLLLGFGFEAGAQNSSVIDKKTCEKMLLIAEEKQTDWIYDACGFANEATAWYTWAPVMSSLGYRKALYELCRRYPTHDYAKLYCQKSADLGYLPAMYWLADKNKNTDSAQVYKANLQRIIAANNINGKTRLVTEADYATRKAYEDLAKIYLASSDIKEREKGLTYLQIAADTGSASASHSLGALLFWNNDEAQQALSEKYLWKAILMGCPAAEENLGVMTYYKQGRLAFADAKEEIDSRLYTCQASEKSADSGKLLKPEDCACQEVLAWFSTQKNKPFLIVKIGAGKAVLKDPAGHEYSVEKGDKVTDGFVVEDVRQTAVIVRRVNERYVLLYREDVQCVDLCANPTVIPRSYLKKMPPYELTFSADECQHLAKGIENLNNPLKPFRGLPECQLQDWGRWGEQALSNGQNKHLFLLANFEKSEYIPSYLALAQMMIQKNAEQYESAIDALFDKIARTNAQDELSEIKKEKAYCIYAQRQIGKDNDKAFAWAVAGADGNYPYSLNILGVMYAKGLGTKKDPEAAKQAFLNADKYDLEPFITARKNLKALQEERVGDLDLGNCDEIENGPDPVTVQELSQYY